MKRYAIIIAILTAVVWSQEAAAKEPTKSEPCGRWVATGTVRGWSWVFLDHSLIEWHDTVETQACTGSTRVTTLTADYVCFDPNACAARDLWLSASRWQYPWSAYEAWPLQY